MTKEPTPDQLARAIMATNRPTVTITQLSDGSVSMEFKNGLLPPALCFSAAQMLIRAANQMLDEQDLRTAMTGVQ